MRMFRTVCTDFQCTVWKKTKHLSHTFNNDIAFLSNAAGIFWFDRCFSTHFNYIEDETTGEMYGTHRSQNYSRYYYLSWLFKSYR
jgi:hypothetical protein